jgi:hypothetical protein
LNSVRAHNALALMGEYASRAREWDSEPVNWITRELEVLKSWEAERLASRLF